jgi:1-deoxy-D-xylulose-5-phosphate reductoisomerase
LSLAFVAAKAGGTAPAVLNAANEVAVAAFLDEGLPYLTIPSVVEHCLSSLPPVPADSLEIILGADALARQTAHQFIRALQK